MDIVNDSQDLLKVISESDQQHLNMAIYQMYAAKPNGEHLLASCLSFLDGLRYISDKGFKKNKAGQYVFHVQGECHITSSGTKFLDKVLSL